MTGDDDVEFAFTAASGPAGEDEDVIEFGQRRHPRPRAAVALLLALAAAIAAVVGYGRASSDKHAAANPPPSAAARPASVTAHPASAPVRAPSVLGPPIRPLVTDAADLAMGVGRLYILRFGSLSALDITTGRMVATVPVRELRSYFGPVYRLAVDDAAGRLWLLREGGVTPANAIEFDEATLRRLATVRLPGTIQGAAVLGQRVYLATADGVRELSPGSSASRLLPGTEGYVGAIAADPDRDRLIYANEGFPTEIVAISPDGGARRVTRLPFGSGQLAVVRGAIWTAGFGRYGAVLERLDPTTLAPIGSGHGPTPALGPGALFVATGSQVIWLRGGGGGDDLWCMDAATGAVGQHVAQLPGPVTSRLEIAPPSSRLAVAYVAPDGVLTPLQLAGCAG